jgi:diaminopimelate decarboxylase
MTAPALPGAPFLAWRGHELTLEGHSLSALAREFGTPLYVYSRAAMRHALAAYSDALQGRAHLLCYAMKAN